MACDEADHHADEQLDGVGHRHQHSKISGGNIESEEEDDCSATRQSSQPRDNPPALQ
jgi:hypothetical protein